MWFFLLKFNIESEDLSCCWPDEYREELQLILNDSEEDFIYVLKATKRIKFVSKENKIIIFAEKTNFYTQKKIKGIDDALEKLNPMLEQLVNSGYIILDEKDDEVSIQN